MKVSILLLICVIVPALSEIPYRYKGGPRGPPMPPRPPLPPQYKGKWPQPMHQPQRGPNRNYPRPIPVQMGHASYKQPVIVPRPVPQRFPQQVPQFPQQVPQQLPQVHPTPVNFPTAVWKSPANVYKPPNLALGKPYEFISQTVKPLEIGPTIVPNTIKQVGEKGPIHTIPAPKLSLADKPANFKEEASKATYNFKEDFSGNPHPNAIPQALPLYQPQPQQYQVNEFNPEFLQKPFFQRENFQGNFQGENFQSNLQGEGFKQYKPEYPSEGFQGDLASLQSVVPGGSFGQPQQAILASQSSIISPPVPGVLSTAEIMQIINSIPDQRLGQPTVVDSYGQPIQGQNKFIFQTPQPTFPTFQEFQQNFKPEMHTFNYVEPRKPSTEVVDHESQGSEAIAQSQYVQNYFTNENPQENAIEEEKGNKILSQYATKGEVPQNIFFSTLPNREAAETLATLQAAGNVNSNLMKNIDEKMRIYVPEEDEEMETSEEKQNAQQEVKIYENTYPDNHRSPDSVEYDDYSSSKEENVSFGSRIRPKNDS